MGWQEIHIFQLPSGLRWDTQPQDAGQIVEVQYGTLGQSTAGPLDGWKRVIDHSVFGGDPIYYRREVV